MHFTYPSLRLSGRPLRVLSAHCEPWRVGRVLNLSLLLLAVACAMHGGTALHAQDGTWNADLDGDWGDSARWLGGTIANGADNTAFFTFNITGNRVVNLESPQVISCRNGQRCPHAPGATAGGKRPSGSFLTSSPLHPFIPPSLPPPRPARL